MHGRNAACSTAIIGLVATLGGCTQGSFAEALRDMNVDWTCAQVSACSSGCGIDTVCIDDCRSLGCDSAKTAFDALKDCGASNCWSLCGSEGSSDACDACVGEHCGAEISACDAQSCALDDGDDVVTEPPPAESLACGGVYACAEPCVTDMGCINACVAAACDAAASDAFNALTGCAAAACWRECGTGSAAPGCGECVAASCGDQLAACDADVCDGATGDPTEDPTGDPTGDPTEEPTDEPPGEVGIDCLAISDCADDCGTNTSCMDACEVGACASAIAAFEAISSCGAGACWSTCMMGPSAPACTDCVANHCAAQIATCEANVCEADDTVTPEPEAGSCAAIAGCAHGCSGSGDSYCITQCRNQGCPTSQVALDAIVGCLETSCGFDCILFGDYCDRCLETNCAAHLDNCTATEC
jgi:hypothetical protein